MKTSYIYIAVFVIAAAVLIIFTNTGDKNKEVPKDISNKEMPQDEIHKGLKGNPNVTAPSKDNVNKSVIAQMDLMKEDLAKTPDDTSKMRIYADLLASSHKQDEAIDYYNKILKKDPKRKDILFSLTYVYYNKQDYKKAEELTNKVLAMDKKDIQAQYNLGAIAASKGDIERARNIWVKLIQENPKGETTEMARQNLTRLK